MNEKECWRSYCSRLIIRGAPFHYYSQQEKTLDQIFGFILCERIGLKLETFLAICSELIKEESVYLLPNIIVSLEDGLFVYLNTQTSSLKDDKTEANVLYNVRNEEGNFQYLLNRINYFINNGRTSDIIPFEKYIIKSNSISPNGRIQQIWFGESHYTQQNVYASLGWCVDLKFCFLNFVQQRGTMKRFENPSRHKHKRWR